MFDCGVLLVRCFDNINHPQAGVQRAGTDSHVYSLRERRTKHEPVHLRANPSTYIGIAHLREGALLILRHQGLRRYGQVHAGELERDAECCCARYRIRCRAAVSTQRVVLKGRMRDPGDFKQSERKLRRIDLHVNYSQNSETSERGKTIHGTDGSRSTVPVGEADKLMSPDSKVIASRRTPNCRISSSPEPEPEKLSAWCSLQFPTQAV